MIGAHAAADFDARATLCSLQRVADQFTRRRPIEPAATLRGVHRFRDAKPEIPKIVPEMDRLFPVDRRVQPGIGVGQGVCHNMRSRKRNAVEILGVFLWRETRSARLSCTARACDRRSAERASPHLAPYNLDVRHVEPAPLLPALHAELG